MQTPLVELMSSPRMRLLAHSVQVTGDEHEEHYSGQITHRVELKR